MTPTEIKVILLRRGITQVELAKQLGVHRTTVAQAINNLRRRPRVRAQIANFLGIPVKKLWPDN
ncbi:MAG: helix-turn-helix domain-containing protein [bacterium]